MADRRNPYFKFYPADFMGGVRGMTAQEVGVYTMLLCRMYEEDGPIGDDAFRLSTYCGMREKTFIATLEKLVRLGKIERYDGLLSNDRASREISSRSDGVEVAIRAGKVSAEKRQQKQRPIPTGVDDTFNHTDTDTDTDTKERTPLPPQGGRGKGQDGFAYSRQRKTAAQIKAEKYQDMMAQIVADSIIKEKADRDANNN